MKLSKEQKEYCEKLFQLNHLYLMIDVARSLTLPDDLMEEVVKLQHYTSAEHAKLFEEMSDEIK